MLKKLLLASALVIPGALAHADSIQLGELTCNIGPGGAFIVSKKSVDCKFKRNGRATELYTGNIKSLGANFGITGKGEAAWIVLQVVGGEDTRGILMGDYVGASANASLGVGLGANLLIGGFNKSISLQPLSVQGQVGLNVNVGLTEMNLTYVGSED